MSSRPPLQFLERHAYRRQRLIDAARVLPIVGLVLVLFPVLWGPGRGLGAAAQTVFIFLVWLVLVIAAAAVSRGLRVNRRFADQPMGSDDGQAPQTAQQEPPRS